MYVMTCDYGAASQLEKIDMIDFAELIVLNKFDRRGAEDALRDVRKQWKRNRTAFDLTDEQVPVYPTIASQFNDPGVTWMFTQLCRLLREKLSDSGIGSEHCDFQPDLDTAIKEPRATVLIPGQRVRYLAEIAEQGRGINDAIDRQAEAACKAQRMHHALTELGDPALPEEFALYAPEHVGPNAGAHMHRDSDAEPSYWETENGEKGSVDRSLLLLRQRYNEAVKDLSSEAVDLLRAWPARAKSVTDEVNEYQVRDKTIRVENYRESLSHQKIPKVAPPKYRDWGDTLRFLMRENLPGAYPYTGGVYPYRRTGEDPIRMFAGEGTPERTNRRFHYLSRGPAGRAPVHRLRLGHPVRRGPGRAPGHLRQDRQLRRVHRHAGRHEEAVLRLRPVRAHHLRVHDHQRPGADDPGHVHEHRHRPERGEVPARGPPSAGKPRADKVDEIYGDAAARTTPATCRTATTAWAWACWACPATKWSTPRPTRRSRKTP